MITSVTYALQGTAYTLEYDESTGKYRASIPVPRETSWNKPNHQFVGTLTATNRDDLGKENTVTQDAGFRVLEQNAPTINVRHPYESALILITNPTIEWICSDAESGIGAETIAFCIDGIAQNGIKKTPIANGYLCQCVPEFTQGVHTLSFDVSDNDGNAAQTVNITVAAYLLITDRTEADAARSKYLAKRIDAGTATPDEIAEFNNNDLKGSYNDSDMNRVGTVVWFLHQLLAKHGYSTTVTAKRNWNVYDKALPKNRAEYLEDVRAIRNSLTMLKTTPNVPDDMIHFLWSEANDIEQILVDANFLIEHIEPTQIYSGEVFAGEV